MDIEDIKTALDAANDAKELLENLDLRGAINAMDDLVDPSTFVDEDACPTLENELASIEAAGPNEGEHEEHHAGWLEGFQAAIDHLRDQYV
jgi:hypothetical protein